MSTRAILTYETADGKKITQFFKTVNEAKAKVEFLREVAQGNFFNFKIKIVKLS